MAETLALCEFVIFFVALITCLQIQSTAGRPIKLTNAKEMATLNLHQSNSSAVNIKNSPAEKKQMPPPKAETGFFDNLAAASKEDFRPTAPGYSPGVGHPKEVDNLHQSSTTVASSTGELAASTVSSKDDFRPTAPGYSPGVGHPKGVFSSSAVEYGSKDDYRPTQPGHSPGVGHKTNVEPIP